MLKVRQPGDLHSIEASIRCFPDISWILSTGPDAKAWKLVPKRKWQVFCTLNLARRAGKVVLSMGSQNAPRGYSQKKKPDNYRSPAF